MKPYLRDFVPNAFEDIPDATERTRAGATSVP